MYVFGNRRWSALVVAFSLTASLARAGMITPSTISSPPSPVNSNNNTPVYPSNFVTSQYNGFGLSFANGSAITNLNGVNVWVPTEAFATPFSSVVGKSIGVSPGAQINYAGTLSGSFVTPGTLTSTAVSSVTLNIIGPATPYVLGTNGQLLNISPVLQSGFGGGQAWTYTGSDIGSFSVVPDPLPGNTNSGGVGVPATTGYPAWGVAGVSFTTANTPEPSSLALAGLGLLGLATRQGWRRRRHVA